MADQFFSGPTFNDAGVGFSNENQASQGRPLAMLTQSSPQNITPGYIRDMYMRGTKALRGENYNYWLNRSFLAGEQWITWDRVRNTLRELPRDPVRVRVTVNKLWPSSRTIMAKLMQRSLVFEVPPTSSDDASVRGAKTSEAILRHCRDAHDWEKHREYVCWSMWVGGTGFLALDWEAGAGTSLGVTPTGKGVGTGDIKSTPLSIVEVAFEPGTRDFETAQWWIRILALPPAQVQRDFQLEREPAADAIAGVSPYQSRLVQQGERQEIPLNMTLVMTYYERPSVLNPTGTIATTVGDKIVDGPHEWYFPWKDRLNIVCFRETKVPGRAAGDTVVTSAVPVQTAFNASWSNIIEHMKLAGNARLMVPDASLDGVDELTDLPSEIVTYNSGAGEPHYLSPPTMPQWWIEQPTRLALELDTILGVHATSRGEAPTNIDSGVGLSILVEQDNTPIGHMVKELAYGFGRYASLVLKLYEVKVRETRTAVMGNGSNVPETVRWTGKSLEGQTHAIVPEEAIQPRSRAAQFAMARDLWDRQITQDPVVFAKIADLQGQDDILAGLNLDASKAERENHLMAQGEVMIPRDFDNHGVHIAKHNEFRKTERYETMDPKIQHIYDAHIQAHETMAAEEAGKREAQLQTSAALAAAPTGAEIPPTPQEAAAASAGPGGKPNMMSAFPPPEGGFAPPGGALAPGQRHQFFGRR
jgi:hypothetical protein